MQKNDIFVVDKVDMFLAPESKVRRLDTLGLGLSR